MASYEPMNDNYENKSEERRKQVMLGELPDDFLRVTPLTSEQQLSLDEQTAIALQHQFTVASAVSGRLTISVVEAKLNKNYGLTRMDPYVRLRIGNTIYETNTDYNGARNPRWNKSFNCFFISQDKTIHLEIFDECAFSLDERIAWASYDIPKSVLQGETVNEWIELSGKLGEKKEGTINIVITCQPIPAGTLIYHPKSMVTVIPYGPFAGKEGVVSQEGARSISRANADVSADVITTEEEFKQVIEMFPNVEEDIVRAIMESNRGNKEHIINALLELSDVT
ncbi:toll-interacting protein [Trichonephila inaurata madagascariensis]|uniref:Toll-interacting protein n=1 Tax=Trichonephila inaurata madagascariensis TaxID=2747483 RepID=A0A8X7CKD2_9ARAC|nr:toll-interacting protein [Trichonephila inaurata madagascariensis]